MPVSHCNVEFFVSSHAGKNQANVQCKARHLMKHLCRFVLCFTCCHALHVHGLQCIVKARSIIHPPTKQRLDEKQEKNIMVVEIGNRNYTWTKLRTQTYSCTYDVAQSWANRLLNRFSKRRQWATVAPGWTSSFFNDLTTRDHLFGVRKQPISETDKTQNCQHVSHRRSSYLDTLSPGTKKASMFQLRS